jgi:structural maintenance of chromosome 3 (chondroitin sulfate proteoglycan 6)
MKAERILQSTVDKTTNNGLQAVKRITAENRIPGVYGPLIELFEVDNKFMTAVEVTAGNR